MEHQRVTSIGLPGVPVTGLTVHGRKTHAKMVALYRGDAKAAIAAAELILAADDDQFHVTSYRNTNVQASLEMVRPTPGVLTRDGRTVTVQGRGFVDGGRTRTYVVIEDGATIADFHLPVNSANPLDRTVWAAVDKYAALEAANGQTEASNR